MRFLIDASMSPVVVQELRTAGHDAEGQGRLELTSYRAAITDVFAFATFDDVGYVHYRDAWAWRHDVEAVLDDLDGLLESGFGVEVEVVALAELAMVELKRQRRPRRRLRRAPLRPVRTHDGATPRRLPAGTSGPRRPRREAVPMGASRRARQLPRRDQ
jgi:hypothetical protein